MKNMFELGVHKTWVLSVLFVVVFNAALYAGNGNWLSPALGANILYTTTDPAVPLKDAHGNVMTVVYLENLGFDKIGGDSNPNNVSWLLSQGYRVIELNYAFHANAISPKINADIIAINDALNNGLFCGLSNCSKYRSYILFEGYRILRDVAFFNDDPTVYNYPSHYTFGDSLYMDIVYPANASVQVPVILSFSYSNSWGGSELSKHQRLNLGNTLAGFDDSFLQGAPANGIAWAIADHPKYCDWGQGKPTGGANKAYGSFQVNPDAAQKVKSAIRTLRVKGAQLGLSGQIGIYGFSRGADAGAMAIGDKVVPQFENAGLHIGITDDVQAAALGPGVFDFTQIYNATGDGDSNLETRCPAVWGPLSSNRSVWEFHSAANLVESSATAPVMFFYNTDDALYYQDQIAQLKAKLDAKAIVNTSIINYGTGHSVPKTTAALSAMYGFFGQYLSLSNTPTASAKHLSASGLLQLSVSPNPMRSATKLTFWLQKAAYVRIEVCSALGNGVFVVEKKCDAGWQTESLDLTQLCLQQGLYVVKITADGNCASAKLLHVL